jgi:hypothetical protein
MFSWLGQGGRVQTKTKVFLIASLVSLLIIAVVIIDFHYARTINKVRLTVRAIYLLDQSAVTGATVEVVSSNGRVAGHLPLDGEGTAVFYVSPGIYVVRMASGYTGQVEIDLQSGKEVALSVVPVLH